jgi:hypothetical protein
MYPNVSFAPFDTLALPRIQARSGERAAAIVMLVAMLLQTILPLVPAELFASAVSTPSTVAAETSAPPPVVEALPPAPAYPLPAELQGKPEVTALRTSHTATFDLGDGKYATLEDTTPLHYQDADGNWLPVNPFFRQVDGKWLNDANTVHVEVDRSFSAARVGLTSAAVAWQPLAVEFAETNGGARPLAAPRDAAARQPATRSQDGQTVRFAGSWENDLQDQWQSRPGSVEYTMRLAARPAVTFWQPQPAALDLRVQLTLRPGTVLRVAGEPATLPVTTNQALSFVGPDGDELVLQPPVTYEQGNPAASVAGEYVLSATGKPDVVELRVRTPWAWLAAAERQYPVIIDPIFQMRAPTSAWIANYALSDTTVPASIYASTGSRIIVGRAKNGFWRSVVRFQIPWMPLGTMLDRGYLYAQATGHELAARAPSVPQYALSTVVALHEVSHSNWQGGGQPLQFDTNPIDPDQQWASHVDTADAQTGIRWDVTTQLKKWLVANPNTPDALNHGLLLRATTETCEPNLLPNSNIQNPLCGLLYFDVSNSSWSDMDLANTQASSTEDNPFFNPTTRGGLRLVVFYHNDDLLTLGEVSGVDLPMGGGAPPGNAPYFGADHLYKLPAFADNMWQAIVVRGRGQRQGPNPPQGAGQIYQHPLQGRLELALKTQNDVLELASVTPPSNKVGYILFNGMGTPWDIFDNNTVVRVSAVGGETAPFGYDIRLHPQQQTISTIQSGTTPKNGPQKLGFSFDSANPLGLWDVAMPLGTNSRIKVRIITDGTKDNTFLKQYADEFSVRLVRSDAQGDLPLSHAKTESKFGAGGDSSLELKLNQDGVSGQADFLSNIFTAASGKYALAVAYSGPQVTSWTVPYCDTENCAPPAQVVPIKYVLEISVHSCPAGQFPTSNGSCQIVECPTVAFPQNTTTTYYEEAGGIALWYAGGWQSAGGTAMKNFAGPAPLLGPPMSGGARQAPRVAIVGGTVTYDKGANPHTVTFNASDVLLINCGSPTGNVKTFTYYQPYYGAMALTGQNTADVAFAPVGARMNFVDPWPAADREAGDITNEQLRVKPRQGLFTGSATLRRVTATNGLVNHNFNTQWSVTANGWLDLQRSISLANGGSTKVASLALNLGNTFSLDTPDAVDRDTVRYFAGVRAEAATVIQDARLGGASKPVKAVILPRGATIPTEPARTSCAPANCLDLRAPTEIFGVLNRTWEMPDVHTDVQPGTVAFSSEGAMTVYSVDHPELMAAGANGAQDFSQSFSFDAYKATVSVANEPCEEGGPAVLVIRGETRIALPNLGSTADPNAGITAQFKLCEAPPDGIGLRSVVLRFDSPVGIPIGASGMFLTTLGGTVKIRPEGTRVEVDVAFQTEPTGPGGILRATGKVVIDTQGLFAFQGSARLLGVFTADGSLWVAWNPLDIGFEITGGYEDWLYGTVRAHLWRGRGWNDYNWLPDNDAMHFTASIEATIQIPEGALVDWGPVIIPPMDIGFSVALEFGEFCTNNSCTTYEWGIKGSFTVFGYEAGIYYGFDEGLDFILGNDDHILIDQYGGAQASPILAAGADASDEVQVQPAPAAVDGTTLIPFPVSVNAENILVGLGWQAGAPAFSLINPDGVEITAVNAAQHQAQTYANATSALFGVKAPKPGVWQARIANLSAQGVEHYKFVFLANKGQPGTPGNRGAILLPAVQNAQPANNVFAITWQVPADTSDMATVALYYRRTDVITGNLQIDVPIVRNLPAKTGSYAWNTGRLLEGAYQIKAVIDDGVNDLPAGKVTIPDDACQVLTAGLPRQRAFDPQRFPGIVTLLSPGTVRIVDAAAPDAPGGFTVNPVDGALMVRWNPAAAPDVYAYQLRWGPKSPVNPLGFEPKNQALVTAGQELVYRIGAVFNSLEYGVNVAAIDVNGNASAPAATLFATPVAGSNPVPLAPTNLARTNRTSDSASFLWTAPAAGPAPAGYRVTYTKLGANPQTAFVDVAATNATLTGLQTGAVYAVQVAAFNAQGWRSSATDAVYVQITDGVDGNGDGLFDDLAAVHGLTSAGADSDGDGLSNATEQEMGSNPTAQDSDGDGYSDGEEQAAGTNWHDSFSFAGFTQPRLALAEDNLRFLAKQQAGGAAAPQSVKWVNAGAGVLNLTASSASPWLQASVLGDQVQVAVDSSSLAPGFYSGVVKLAAAPGSAPLIGDPGCIRVKAWVLPADDDVSARQSQSISFAPLADKTLGAAPFTVSATATSGLPVSFASATPAVCMVAGNTVTMGAAGLCIVVATQAGDATHNAAPSVSQSFTVVDPAQPLQASVFLPMVMR